MNGEIKRKETELFMPYEFVEYPRISEIESCVKETVIGQDELIKGVATSLGVLLTLNWQIGLICLVFAVVLITLTKMVSVGSISAAILFPILTIFIGQNYIVTGNYIISSIILAVLIVFNHRANVKRILTGTENKISFKGLK